MDFLVKQVVDIAKDAGTEILKIYSSGFSIDIKKDNSPVTKADIVANSIICKRLKGISDYPIVTEESYVEYKVRKKWNKFWLVDPLDGTKDFIAKNGYFTVNIAPMEAQKPILGVVYVPVSGDVYFACVGKKAYKNGVKIYNSSNRVELVGCDSNFHSTKSTVDFFNKYDIKNIKRFGSSIKICKLAEGEVVVYPRFNGTKEWDTAASHIIAHEAGCKLVDIQTKQELLYNKETMQNNFFIASRNDLEFTL